MARYRRSTARRRTGRRTSSRSTFRSRNRNSAARASSRRVSRSRSVRTSGRGRSGNTIRIVIDQAPAPSLTAMPIRNEAGQLVKASPVRRARF